MPAFPQADKVAHALFYGGLAFLICWWWGKAVVSVRGAVLAALGTQVHGAIMELLQLVLVANERTRTRTVQGRLRPYSGRERSGAWSLRYGMAADLCLVHASQLGSIAI